VSREPAQSTSMTREIMATNAPSRDQRNQDYLWCEIIFRKGGLVLRSCYSSMWLDEAVAQAVKPAEPRFISASGVWTFEPPDSFRDLMGKGRRRDG
jgi:hypothetical protein